MMTRFSYVLLTFCLVDCSSAQKKSVQNAPMTSSGSSFLCGPREIPKEMQLHPERLAEVYDGKTELGGCSWTEIRNGIALAKDDFLAIYPALKKQSDGAMSEELDSAFGFVLQSRAEQVLKTIEQSNLSSKSEITRNVCRATQIDADVDSDDEIKAVRTRINDLRLRAEGLNQVKDTKLVSLKKICLNSIDQSIAEYEKLLPQQQ